jgi:hypothetical protein
MKYLMALATLFFGGRRIIEYRGNVPALTSGVSFEQLMRNEIGSENRSRIGDRRRYVR